MNSEVLIYEKDGGLAWVTLNRPEALNAMNMEVRDELWQVLHAIQDDPDVAVAIFKGAGEHAFSSGADISEFGTAPSVVEARRARRERDLWGYMLAIDKPLIAAIHGYALGAGIELSMCCDLRIAADDARLGLPEVGLAYIPSAGGTQLMPRLVSPGVALGLILSGDAIDAQEALRIGLVQRVVPRQRLYVEAEALARQLMARGPLALRYAKQAVTQGLDLPLAEGLALEARLACLVLASDDAREGLKALQEGRAPQFVGM
ncbi:MAG: enoyl-CoA hydratase/isomerase family protein [Dehalococcoidia bacterium]